MHEVSLPSVPSLSNCTVYHPRTEWVIKLLLLLLNTTYYWPKRLSITRYFCYVTAPVMIDLPSEQALLVADGSDNAVLRSTKMLRILRLARLFKLVRLFKLQSVSIVAPYCPTHTRTHTHTHTHTHTRTHARCRGGAPGSSRGCSLEVLLRPHPNTQIRTDHKPPNRLQTAERTIGRRKDPQTPKRR